MANGTREIVLLPGLDGTGELFDRLAARLEPELDVKIVRYPQDPSLGYAGYAEIVRNEIGNRSVYLLGESFSGPVAVRVAAQLGQQVQGIILAATFLKNPWPGALLRRAALVNPRSTPAKIRDAILMGDYGDPELVSKIGEIVQTLSRRVRAARVRAVADVDVRDDFARLACRILVLHGRGDWLVRKSPIQLAVSEKGMARMVVLPGAHMLLQTRSAEAAAEIIHFTKSTAEAHYEA
ncbi:alpha/beta fold hydrolase [Hyphomicrobium sp.]|jgi:pimeloyl-ACP methyl ester carboxylesterase|uniref:alpha/beta fold hydrolase n=1 Tax=Hyphomicrobium sp. TaxID=82 RepID=UPI00356B2454